MSYSGVVRRLLISCPSDVAPHDLAIIHKTISYWNGIYGERFGTAIMPISWSMQAAAEFGQPPQEIINNQLVNKCDGCIAVFANRLGTPTSVAESGTAEEIQRLGDSGKYVGVLHCRRSVDTLSLDLNQVQLLNKYLERLKRNAVVLDYSDDATLARHVETILVQAVTRDKSRAEMQLGSGGQQPPKLSAEVWPRVDSKERPRTDARGRTRMSMSRDWYLVLHNTGSSPAHDVRFEFDQQSNGGTWDVPRTLTDGAPDVEILAPNSEARFAIAVSLGSAPQALCKVTWVDESGPGENTATLRLM